MILPVFYACRGKCSAGKPWGIPCLFCCGEDKRVGLKNGGIYEYTGISGKETASV